MQRLTKLDQQRLITERDHYRDLFFKAQEDLRIMQLEVDELKQEALILSVKALNLDELGNFK